MSGGGKLRNSFSRLAPPLPLMQPLRKRRAPVIKWARKISYQKFTVAVRKAGIKIESFPCLGLVNALN